MKPYYVLREISRGGFAANVPMEGWIFTVILSAATKFTRYQDAVDAQKYYPKDSVRIEIVQTEHGAI